MKTEVLTQDQIERLSRASLDILQRVGVLVPHEEILRRFAGAGATVDYASQLVRLPPDLVLRLVDGATKQFAIYGRDLSKNAEFGFGKRNYNSIAGEASWLDSPGEQRRYATMADVATAARFGDAMESLTIVGAMADPAETPVSYRCVAVMAELIRHTTKPITFWFHDRASARFIIEMLAAVRGSTAAAASHPMCYPLMEPISPLRFPFHGIDLLFETAKANMPVEVGPMAQMGLSAPATIAGTIAQENAEILAGICITQLVKPGMPVCYGGICHAFDMRTTQMIFGGPEQAILGVAMTQMGKHYDLPVYINVGLSDSKRPDAQAGLETGVTLALGAAAGADVFGHMGISGVDQAASLDMLVFQNEVVSYVESAMRGIDTSDDAIGLLEIEAAGPGGSFIDRDHTAAHFRREMWFPKLLDRDYYQQWLDHGAPSTEARCANRKAEVLATHTPEPLPDDLSSAIEDIVTGAKQELEG